jgi:hypothetical protein
MQLQNDLITFMQDVLIVHAAAQDSDNLGKKLMNKFKYIANEGLKKRVIIENCAHCPNIACSGLQKLDNFAQLPKLASQYVKKLAYACETFKTFPKTSICTICFKDKDSTVYREQTQKYVCDECMHEIIQFAEEVRARRVRNAFTEIDSALVELDRQIEANQNEADIQFEQQQRITRSSEILRRHEANLQSFLKDSYERQVLGVRPK